MGGGAKALVAGPLKKDFLFAAFLRISGVTLAIPEPSDSVGKL